MKSLIVLGLLIGLASQANAAIPKLNLDIKGVTVSGLSSGGYMATQFHMAHSDWVKGAAIIAGGPNYCGQNDIKIALSQCVNKLSDSIPLDTINDAITAWSDTGKIASLNYLKESKVWLLHGTKDQRVIAPVSKALYEQYQSFVPIENIKFVQDKPFAHHFPTLNNGVDCATSEAPFIGRCDYDAAGELLTHLNGPLQPRVDIPEGDVIAFDQQELGGGDASSLAIEGYVYVPKSCVLGEPCKLHISFHGCNQNTEAVGQEYVRNAGLNNWADNNRLVILYPQTKKSLFMPLNPQGCWDWWGYTNEHYATKDGPQIKAVAQIVTTLSHKTQEP